MILTIPDSYASEVDMNSASVNPEPLLMGFIGLGSWEPAPNILTILVQYVGPNFKNMCVYIHIYLYIYVYI